MNISAAGKCRRAISGQGISALSRPVMAQVASPALVWRPLVDPAVARSIGIVRHNARSLSPASQLFVRELQRQARIIRMSDQLPPHLPDEVSD